MIDTRSLREFAQKQRVILPIDPASRAVCPQVCISLLGAGDMWGGEAAGSNRQALLASIGVEEARVRALHQVHSRWVVIAEDREHGEPVSTGTAQRGSGSERLPEGDALITRNRNLVLSVRVADCCPVFLFDRVTGAYAAAHSGWRGTGIAKDVLGQLNERFGTRPADVAALLGPGIRSCCYDVPEDRARNFAVQFGADAVTIREGRFYLDLPSVNAKLLLEAGVPDVVILSDCTACSPYLGSYRREGPVEFTHMLALIGHFG